MIDYNPKDAVQVWPEGEYEATLAKVEDTTSKRKPDGSGGNPMQVWTFEVYHSDGRQQLISDYVVVPAATFKIKQLAIALDKRADFDAGTFQAEDYIGVSVVLALAVAQQEGFDDKNKVGKIKPAGKPEPAAAVTGNGAKPPAPQQRPQQPSRPPARQPTGGKPPRQEAEQPFGEEQTFQEADIPFAWSGRRGQPL